MDRHIKQRNAIEFLAKNGENGAEIFKKLKNTYGNECLSWAQVFSWVKQLKNERESASDASCRGRPITAAMMMCVPKFNSGSDKKVRQFLRTGSFDFRIYGKDASIMEANIYN